jgi:hypothetical protein
MRQLLAYILGVLGVSLVAAGGVGLVLGVWFRETNWIAQAVGPLVIGGALVGGARYLLRRHAEALSGSRSVPA